jgi:peptidoglycan biosynthesis protein MviN/MurJ (putative lipid II flippase)
MVLGDSKKPTLGILRLLILDVPAVLVLTLLITHGVIPLYPGAAIAYSLLFVVNVLLVWALRRQRLNVSGNAGSAQLSLWIAATVFTPAGIAAMVAYVRGPSMPLAVQAGVAVLLVGYIWFAIYRLRRTQGDKLPK